MALQQHQQRQHMADQPPPYYSSSSQRDESLKLPALSASNLSSRASHIPTLDPLPSLAQNSLDSRHLPSPHLNSHGDSRSSSQTLRTSSTAPLKPLDVPSTPSNDSAHLSTPTDAIHAMTMDDSSRRRDASVSMDDPDDRMAAEALCGLGKVDSSRSSVRSPSGYETPLQYYPIEIDDSNSRDAPEPLLSLLTSSHPWLGGTINNSLSAYSSTKSHSPRFIQYGANFVERKIGSPVANTVGSVGRKTGVEGSLRRYLGSRRISELDQIDPEILDQQGATSKRRRISSEHEEPDTEQRHGVQRTMSGHASIDTLPVYDENRSPAYEDSENDHQQQQDQSLVHVNGSNAASKKRPASARSWSTQLMISTSGLGAALNQPSLRSLKYCLSILRSANARVSSLMEALKKLLSDYNNAVSGSAAQRLEEGNGNGGAAMDLDSTSDASQTGDSLTKRIQHLNAEIWQTLKNVVDSVSRYTGGALPENASVVVRWQLMSVPRRWQRAVSTSANSNSSDSTSATGEEPGATASEKEAVSNAHRMLAFAIEGIDMMEQVGGVVDSTILSAERWLDSLGRKPKQEGENDGQDTAAGSDTQAGLASDVHMEDEAANRPQQEGEMLIDTST